MQLDVEEMEIMEDDHADLAGDFSAEAPPGGKEGKGGDRSLGEDFRQRMGENVTQMVWQAGTQGARKAWNLYGNIDILRPYFDVEPKEVQTRLLYSLIPQRAVDQVQRVPAELYGPTMVILTLIALLLYQMKSADHQVEEGTLMGSAFGVCFMYWVGASGLVWFVSFVCNVRITFLQVLSMMGYGLFGHCIVLFLGTVVHTSHDHMFFYLMWAAFGGLATLRMACIIMSRASGKTERIVVIGVIAFLHLAFLLYLHFAYHTIVEELSDVFSEKLVPQPIATEAAQNNMMQKMQNDGAYQDLAGSKDAVQSLAVHNNSLPNQHAGLANQHAGVANQHAGLANQPAELANQPAAAMAGGLLLSKLRGNGTLAT